MIGEASLESQEFSAVTEQSSSSDIGIKRRLAAAE